MPKDVHTAMAALVRVTAAAPTDPSPPHTRPPAPAPTHPPAPAHPDAGPSDTREQSTPAAARHLLSGLRRVARALRV